MSQTIPGRLAPLLTASLVLGVGLGGFVDGILLHQILQWHNMLSSVVPPTDLISAKYNMVWDGVFHAATWVCTLTGIVLMFRAARRVDTAWSARVLGGGMLAGWGVFNFVEGLIDHQILGIHHVHPGGSWLVWDLAFLFGLGLGMIGLGLVIARSGRDEELGASMSPGLTGS
jgi:uncharacterized membrane protein